MNEAVQSALDRARAQVPAGLREATQPYLDTLAPRIPADVDARVLEQLPRVLACSDFVTRAFTAEPELFDDLVGSGELLHVIDAGELSRRLGRALEGVGDETELKRRLRRFRRRETVRVAFRDLAGFADLIEVIETLSALADASIDQALRYLSDWARQKYGTPMNQTGTRESRFVVLGMGKLGGQELNFSSDVDLIFAYTEEGETHGDRALSNQQFFVQLGQALINALAEITSDGFVFRVDMRLRPDGGSGPLVLCFDATEQYYQTHGRDWERYALIKARPVGGDLAAGEELLAHLRPFIYRKYIDYGVLNAIRDMRTLIEREMKRKGMQEHIKLGPGGIREIEFIGQALQLIRAGREPPLQRRSILGALERLAEREYLPVAARDELAAAYVFLRNVEHRLQMVADQQTHTLPNDPLEQRRIAFATGFADWAGFTAALAQQRERVRAHFAHTFVLPETGAPAENVGELAGVWLGTLGTAATTTALRGAGFADGAAALDVLHGFRRSAPYQALSTEGHQRLDRLMPRVLATIAAATEPNITLARVVHLLEAIGRRTTYFVMLAESPAALTQLVKLCGASEWIARWIARHPIVLDELLDPRTLYELPTHAELASELRTRMASLSEQDTELQMDVLREFHHSHLLRTAAADIGPGLPPERVGAHLADVADAVLGECLGSAERMLGARHGQPRCGTAAAGFAVIGYGKLGSRELGYASDLDMIFLYEGCDVQGRTSVAGDRTSGATEEGATDGKRSVSNEEFFARLGQRVIHLLTTRTPSGVLYEVDMRLRPSGQSGTLVTSLAAFRDYQLNKAWTWEHQALVRARAVAGSAALQQAFAEVRRGVLCRPRDDAALRRDVTEMRERMIAGHAAKHAAPAQGFHLKHSRGGIVDIEFMVQYWTLRWAHRHPALTHHTDNINILEALQAEGLLEAGRVEFLAEAYRRYLSMEHRLKLAERGSVTDAATLGELPQRVRTIWEQTFNDY